MSTAGRNRIAAAARARWAKIKAGADGNAATKTSKPAGRKAKRGGITPEGRARLAAAMKARWAARKKTATAKSDK